MTTDNVMTINVYQVITKFLILACECRKWEAELG